MKGNKNSIDGETKLQKVFSQAGKPVMTTTIGVLVGAVAGGIVASMLSNPEVRERVYESAEKTFHVLKDEFIYIAGPEEEKIRKQAVPNESIKKE